MKAGGRREKAGGVTMSSSTSDTLSLVEMLTVSLVEGQKEYCLSCILGLFTPHCTTTNSLGIKTSSLFMGLVNLQLTVFPPLIR
jgi:hypothetical protein